MLKILYITTAVTALSPQLLFERDSACPDPTQNQCPQTGTGGLPTNFCCPTRLTCVPLAANTTVLCCPDVEGNCSLIAPISCDITQQNIALHPENILKTIALAATLPRCGSDCCPFGFRCNTTSSIASCLMNPDQHVFDFSLYVC